METVNIHLLSVYLKKWSYGDNKLTLNYSYCTETDYWRGQMQTRISLPHNLAMELMNRVFKEAKEKILNKNNKNNKKVVFVGESDAIQKLTTFFTKINKEYNNNKRSKGKFKMISSRSMDLYYNEYEYAPLKDNIKFFVHLSRGINKISGEFWQNSIDDFKKALKYNPRDLAANKYIADAYIKIKKYNMAIKHLEKIVELDPSVDNYCSLSNIYAQIGEYQKGEAVLKRLDEKNPNSLPVLYNKAILAYKQGKGYKAKLDKIYKVDPEWLRRKLLNDWDYRRDGNGNGKNKWNAATAAKYLDFEKPYDLTKKAFNDEVPCYFNSHSGIIRFVKEELDEWVELSNRYNLEDRKYSVHPEYLDDSEKGRKTKRKKGNSNEKTDKPQKITSSKNTAEKPIKKRTAAIG
jgi:tetratricopeptide (TPR) repeat protein